MSRPSQTTTLADRIAARAAVEDDIVPMPDAVIERVAAMLRPMPTAGQADDEVSVGGDRAPV